MQNQYETIANKTARFHKAVQMIEDRLGFERGTAKLRHRYTEAVRLRQIAMYIGVHTFGMTITSVANYLGLTHATVLAGLKRFYEFAKKHPGYKSEVDKLAKEVKNES